MVLKVLGYCNALKPLRMKKKKKLIIMQWSIWYSRAEIHEDRQKKRNLWHPKRLARGRQALIVTIIILLMTLRGSYTVLFISSSKVL